MVFFLSASLPLGPAHIVGLADGCNLVAWYYHEHPGWLHSPETWTGSQETPPWAARSPSCEHREGDFGGWGEKLIRV